MKKKIFVILTCFFLISLTGCSIKESEIQEFEKEKYMIGTTLEDGRHVNFTFDVPYKKDSLNNALLYNEITIEEVINKLEHISSLKDGGSKIYKYNRVNNEFGNIPFYVLVCNSLDDINDIFVAKHKESLAGLCSPKIDDLDGISMKIKEGTLTKTSATIIITDKSKRDNIYGESFQIQKYENDKWIDLESKIEMFFNDIGYKINENFTLELKIDWKTFYGSLKKGKYRILKSTSEPGEGIKHYLTAEFVIE